MGKTVYLTWLLAAVAPSVAAAAIRFELPQVKAWSDGSSIITGALDVLVLADASDLPHQVSSFNVDLHVNSSSVVLGPPEMPPSPLFPGAVTSFSPNPQTLRAARDVFPSWVSLMAEAQLVRVPFSIAAGASGSFALVFGQFNQLADSQAAGLPIVTTDTGTITIYSTADFNEDGAVNGADFLVWQRGQSPSGASSASEYAAWKAAFGLASDVAASAAIPEPSSAVLTAFTIVLASQSVGRTIRHRRQKTCSHRPFHSGDCKLQMRQCEN